MKILYDFITATNGFTPDATQGFAINTCDRLIINATHGTVPGAGQYLPNTMVQLTAPPSPGYVFTEWTGDATGTDNPLSVLMDSEKIHHGQLRARPRR